MNEVVKVIDVVFSESFPMKAKDPHPLGLCPEKPHFSDFKDNKKYNNALEKYETLKTEWDAIDATLPVYEFEALRCVSGLMVRAEVLHCTPGHKTKAELLTNGKLIII